MRHPSRFYVLPRPLERVAFSARGRSFRVASVLGRGTTSTLPNVPFHYNVTTNHGGDKFAQVSEKHIDGRYMGIYRPSHLARNVSVECNDGISFSSLNDFGQDLLHDRTKIDESALEGRLLDDSEQAHTSTPIGHETCERWKKNRRKRRLVRRQTRQGDTNTGGSCRWEMVGGPPRPSRSEALNFLWNLLTIKYEQPVPSY